MLLKYLEEYVLVNIPKVHSSYRVGLENNIIELNCNIIRTNITTKPAIVPVLITL